MMPSPSPLFQVGDRVLVHSLLKAAHLNGRHGCIGGEMDSATGRYPIDFDTWAKRVMAKDVNLKREPVAEQQQEGEDDEEKTDKDGIYVDPMHVADVCDGILAESEGRPLQLILDSIGFLVGSVLFQDPEMQRGLIDIEQTRQQGDMQKIRKLMNTAWSHWKEAKPFYTPDNLNVYELTQQFFQGLPQANPGQKMPTEFYTAMTALVHRTAVRGWNTRIEGEFWIVDYNEDNGGTFLVAKANRHLVYEVFGIRFSLFSRAEEEYDGPILINAVLLPWYGRLVCDQAVKAASEVSEEGLVALVEELLESVELAQEEGRVVAKLRQLELPEPEEEQHCSTPTPTETHLLSQIADMSIARQDESIWCMRRRGYTEHENPHHMGVIINGVGGVAVGPFSCSALEPTSLDILQALVSYCGKDGKMLPPLLLIDDVPCFQRVGFLLKDFEINVQYYPPPTSTPEETEAALNG